MRPDWAALLAQAAPPIGRRDRSIRLTSTTRRNSLGACSHSGATGLDAGVVGRQIDAAEGAGGVVACDAGLSAVDGKADVPFSSSAQPRRRRLVKAALGGKTPRDRGRSLTPPGDCRPTAISSRARQPNQLGVFVVKSPGFQCRLERLASSSIPSSVLERKCPEVLRSVCLHKADADLELGERRVGIGSHDLLSGLDGRLRLLRGCNCAPWP